MNSWHVRTFGSVLHDWRGRKQLCSAMNAPFFIYFLRTLLLGSKRETREFKYVTHVFGKHKEMTKNDTRFTKLYKGCSLCMLGFTFHNRGKRLFLSLILYIQCGLFVVRIVVYIPNLETGTLIFIHKGEVIKQPRTDSIKDKRRMNQRWVVEKEGWLHEMEGKMVSDENGRWRRHGGNISTDVVSC